jgi:hypothetical protein
MSLEWSFIDWRSALCKSEAWLCWPGGDLLFHVLGRSTIGAEGFHGRVRDGIGCRVPRHNHQTSKATRMLDASAHHKSNECLHAELGSASNESDQADRAISTG